MISVQVRLVLEASYKVRTSNDDAIGVPLELTTICKCQKVCIIFGTTRDANVLRVADKLHFHTCVYGHFTRLPRAMCIELVALVTKFLHQ